MTQRRQSLGRDGEQQAAHFLEARGYRIVARNVRAERVEIDLIARRGPLLVFVEVKSRRARGPAEPGHHAVAAEAVDERKQARLRRGARAWLALNTGERRRARRLRFDVVTCVRIETDVGAAIEPEWLRRPDGPLSAKEPEEPPSTPAKDGPENDATAPRSGTRWSIEHWMAAF